MARAHSNPEAALERIRSHIASLTLPAIGFALTPRSDLPLRASKLGGAPSLPKSFDWPENGGRPLDFVLQAELSNAVKNIDACLLPRAGTLSFFYDLDRQPWGYDPADLCGFCVAYTPAEEEVVTWEPPNKDYVLSECEITWFPTQTLPRDGSVAFERFTRTMGLSSEEQNAYYSYAHRFERMLRPAACGGNHHLLGHSDNVQGDMQTEAHLVTNGIYCGDGTAWSDPRAVELLAGADDWLLLLQLDSDDSAGFMWGDSGMLYYWIRRQHLLARRFDHVWMTMQCC